MCGLELIGLTIKSCTYIAIGFYIEFLDIAIIYGLLIISVRYVQLNQYDLMQRKKSYCSRILTACNICLATGKHTTRCRHGYFTNPGRDQISYQEYNRPSFIAIYVLRSPLPECEGMPKDTSKDHNASGNRASSKEGGPLNVLKRNQARYQHDHL